MIVQQSAQSLVLGVPTETALSENRVALTPEGVHLLVSRGHRILIERGAGQAARYTDQAYSEAGAEICENREEVFKASTILKVEPPSEDELALMPGNQTLFSVLQYNMLTEAYIQALLKKKITAISYGDIRDEDGKAPFVRSMAEIAGSQSMALAMEYLSTWSDGKGYAMGGVTGVPPAEVVVLGAGTVGTVIARMASALGATVKVFDQSLTRMESLRRAVGQHIYTSTMQPQVLEKAIKRCDVVIGALRPVHGRTPVVVSEDMVSQMKPRSVIIDVSIDHGGCIETSEVTTWEAPVYTKHEVIHCCVPNLASRVARTASFALNNLTSPLCDEIAEAGGLESALELMPHLRSSVYAYKGRLTDPDIAARFDLGATPLELLL